MKLKNALIPTFLCFDRVTVFKYNKIDKNITIISKIVQMKKRSDEVGFL